MWVFDNYPVNTYPPFNPGFFFMGNIQILTNKIRISAGFFFKKKWKAASPIFPAMASQSSQKYISSAFLLPALSQMICLVPYQESLRSITATVARRWMKIWKLSHSSHVPRRHRHARRLKLGPLLPPLVACLIASRGEIIYGPVVSQLCLNFY